MLHNRITAFLVTLLTCLSFHSCKTTKPAAFDERNAIVLDTLQVTAPRDNPYRASATKVFDLVHTRLEVRFDWEHQYLFGKEYLTVKPHFYPQSSVSLDAKNLDIYAVKLIKQDGKMDSLPYTYDSLKLTIQLDREYTAQQPLTLYIDYKSKPNERKSGGSDAIADDKGLYFINPLGKDSDKPREIWTQGETESNSNWFPTFDKPNYKGTSEIAMTVEKKYTTLSNGLLVNQIYHDDGTRTDYWKMTEPHSPYLVMMAVGEFIITRDKWRGKEVSYYVEPKYATTTRRIFGETPAMMEYFSTVLGVDYPWAKYAQVVARDYVSGAMENTSATLHGENLNRTTRQIIDEDYHDYVSHELFHQWFGDLVTAESWSNLTVNESMADYGEYLWNDHRYGHEYADWKFQQARQKYLNETKRGKNLDLVRFRYEDKEEMFDSHSYEKGGQIQNMLRHIVGDSAYFKSLQLYLKANQYQAAEAHHLRLAFEEVTGRDMNWFWNQWYYNAGHPLLNFEYSYTADSVYVKVTQKHNIDKPLTYELPMRIDIHYGEVVMSNNVVVNKRKQTFAFKALGTPDLIDADAERVLLCEKTENKSMKAYIYQYQNASRYLQRYEAIDSLKHYQKSSYEAVALYRRAIHDPNEAIRSYVVKNILINDKDKDTVLSLLKVVLESDSSPRVRGAVLEVYGKQKDKSYLSTVQKYLGDSSYTVASAALLALNKIDSITALEKVKIFEKEKAYEIKNAMYTVYSQSGDSSYSGYFITKIHQEKGYNKYFLLYHYANFLCRMPASITERGIDSIQLIVTSDTTHNKQILSFGTGAIERIKEYYERKRAVYDGIANSDKKTRKKYEAPTLAPAVVSIDQVINHAKQVLEAMKKGEE